MLISASGMIVTIRNAENSFLEKLFLNMEKDEFVRNVGPPL